MNLVLHIVRKDFRHLRFYLAGWFGLVILRAAVIGYGPLDSSTWDFNSSFYYELLAWFPQICLLPIMVARLVQDDSLSREHIVLVGPADFRSPAPVGKIAVSRAYRDSSTLRGRTPALRLPRRDSTRRLALHPTDSGL